MSGIHKSIHVLANPHPEAGKCVFQTMMSERGPVKELSNKNQAMKSERIIKAKN